MSKVRQQGAALQELFPRDVLPQARFPALQQAAAARRDAAERLRVQCRDVRP
jgi:hypothetical protein